MNDLFRFSPAALRRSSTLLVNEQRRTRAEDWRRVCVRMALMTSSIVPAAADQCEFTAEALIWSGRVMKCNSLKAPIANHRSHAQ